LLAGVGDPHRHFRALHIGGTNGKGSVAAMCAAALRERGAGPVGLYTSPHLISFAERVRIDGAPAVDDLLVAAAERLRPAIERTGATFFEATTAIAFLAMADAGVETAVIEVGLGGRLDATNVIDPIACCITNISREHTEYLGDTIQEIAREKAGILKPGVPAITAETAPDALGVIRGVAAEVGSPLIELDSAASVKMLATGSRGTDLRMESREWGDRTLATPLIGAHQARNAALAAELLALLPEGMRPSWEMIETGFAAVRWPGRFQIEKIRGTTWIFDAAHNAAGVAALAAALDELDPPRPRLLLFGVLSDKDWRTMLRPLLDRVDGAVLTVPDSAPDGRRWVPEDAAAWSAAEGYRPSRVILDLRDAIDRAWTLAPHGTVIVTGSFHTIGDAMSHLGVAT
jgi:dihydrofolate synthase/folylpolyglutamate synthase